MMCSTDRCTAAPRSGLTRVPGSANILAVCDRNHEPAASRYHWVPAAAGWTVGVIATLSLVASVSPLVRWLIKVPREFINDYVFNFPDTSFAWSFVLALLAGALTARKRIAWWALLGNLLIAAGLNIADLVAGDNTRLETFGENLGLALHVAAIILLVLAYREFWAKVRRGALYKAAGVLLAGWAIGILLSWGWSSCFPARWLARIGCRTSSTGSLGSHWPTRICFRAGRTSSSTRCSGCSARWR
ncbi:lysylphosphatidylglycerol biosynthesis bifunctional LysX domain protein [Mycobacterium xenopi 4042]|uniref:Lysylphosphatidylglycerol biosynthesis bifunctional LysX domain protein n=1 Tax=Mycobacterium xenopi 4042 TaxID=1299334 RepID=X8DF94_MYCXE|nr:lysylphosphatidylglycerol biosynthesis bifunctional LysX domain protein [Mycobacterium xenopi 4042]